MKPILIGLLFVFLFVNCNKPSKPSNEIQKTTVSKIQVHPGKKLMEVHCYSCHHPTASEEDRLAPPMIAVKMRYMNSSATKKEFINDMQAWIKNPVDSNVKMYGAVKRFGIMGNLPYPERVIEQIADYMFDNDIAQPEWFEEHYNQSKGSMRQN